MKNQKLERFYHTIISGIAKILNDASLTLRYANGSIWDGCLIQRERTERCFQEANHDLIQKRIG